LQSDLNFCGTNIFANIYFTTSCTLLVSFTGIGPYGRGLTPRLYGHASALTGRTKAKLPPKPVWRAIMQKLRRAGMVSTKRLLEGVHFTLGKNLA
jgi:hypothetical protein